VKEHVALSLVDMSIAEVCARIEANDADDCQITSIYVDVSWMDNGYDEPVPRIEVTFDFTSGREEYYEHHTVPFDDVDAWRRFAKVIQGISLEEFHFYVFDSSHNDITITPPAAECLDALFSQIKCASSINHFTIFLLPSNQVPKSSANV
jgi:hypothetical protein